MRLIDADKLIEEVKQAGYKAIDMFDVVDMTVKCVRLIDSQPTVELTKQGEWVEQRDMREFDFKFYKYSACEKLNEIDAALDDITNYRYCPYCGAKMGGEKK